MGMRRTQTPATHTHEPHAHIDNRKTQPHCGVAVGRRANERHELHECGEYTAVYILYIISVYILCRCTVLAHQQCGGRSIPTRPLFHVRQECKRYREIGYNWPFGSHGISSSVEPFHKWNKLPNMFNNLSFNLSYALHAFPPHIRTAQKWLYIHLVC